MKEIKVFLASSEEMKDDRLLFGDFIRKLNELFNKREKKIVLLEWEDLDASYNGVRKQNEYNEQILNKQKKCAFRGFYFAFHLFEARFLWCFIVLSH